MGNLCEGTENGGNDPKVRQELVKEFKKFFPEQDNPKKFTVLLEAQNSAGEVWKTLGFEKLEDKTHIIE